MMKKFLSILLILSTLSACTGGGDDELFDSPTLVVVDSDNNRVFVLEHEGILSVFKASDLSEIGEQPLVNDERKESIHNLLPSAPIHMAVSAIGTTSRLFIAGDQINDGGSTVFNRLLVLDVSGTNISEANFSPLIVTDGNGATDDTGNLLGGLLATASLIYVTDSSAGQLHIYDTADGSEDTGPISIAGTPNRMSLKGGRLYVANSTDTGADQVITVVNTATLITTEIDLNAPTDDISVQSNDSGTALLAKHATTQRVFVRKVNTSTFASASSIAAGNDSVADGEINTGDGVTSAVGTVLLTTNSSGKLFGYVPQSDGNIELLTFADNLSSFTGETLSTATELTESIDVFKNDDGSGDIVYMTATGTGDLVFTDVGSDEVEARF